MLQRPHDRHLLTALLRGFVGRCPHCGEGPLFRGYLKVVDHCPICGESYVHHRADDAPAYLVIVVVGHIVVPAALALENAYRPPFWVQYAIWLPVTTALALGLLRPIKGAVVALQWALRMHGFGSQTEQ